MSSANKALYALAVITLLFLLQPYGGTWAWLADLRWLYVLLVAFIFAYLLTPLAIQVAWRMNIVDRPDAARKLQKNPIPRIGGLAIFLAILFATIRNFAFSPQLTALMAASSIIFVLGFIDDIYCLPALVRLAVQMVASFIVINSGIMITIIPAHWPLHYFLSALITFIWLIGMSNAVNFMDGVDGLCASMIALSAALFFLISWRTSQSHVSFLLIAVTGACLGFLPYNWKRATVYLGDAGSTFLGFLLAGLSVMGAWADNNPMVALATPILILGIPIFDMIYTTLSRIRNGSIHTFKEWLEFAGRDHFHHRLMNLRLTEVQTVLFILAVNLCLGLGALVIRDTGTKGSILLLLQTIIIFFIIVVLMLLGRAVGEAGKGEEITS